MTAKIRSRTPAEERPSPHGQDLPRQSLRNTRLVIVGGVAGGASAATRARRLCEDCEIILFERGPHVSFATCGLPYFVGGEIAEQDSLLVQTPASLKARFNLDVRINTEVVRIDRAARRIRVREWATAREYSDSSAPQLARGLLSRRATYRHESALRARHGPLARRASRRP